MVNILCFSANALSWHCLCIFDKKELTPVSNWNKAMAAVVAIAAQGGYHTQYNRSPRPQVAGAVDPSPAQQVVALEPVERAETPASFVRVRIHAPLVAHLAAIRDNMPQTRELRREDSATGAAHYQATAKVMSRSHAALPSWEA
jgi:hypothetical protein